jgi:2-oxoglutarate ferredoxin oxidoreductase subunit alpha
MSTRDVLGDSTQFIQGDKAFVYGALLAGCRFFAGYPITPATEVAEEMSKLLPLLGGTYVQMEDEIGSMSAIIGAAWTGKKSMTATSGPGFSLMQENIGYAIMSETPCVIVDVQRGGPSTGQPTKASQGDVMQARYGSHGDYEIIALSPSSVQEALELTIAAFDLAERYRVPVIMLTEESIGHMREKSTIPDIDRPERLGERTEGLPQGVLPFSTFGNGAKKFVTGLTHLDNGTPSTDDHAVHAALVTRLCDKITDNVGDIFMADAYEVESAETVIVSYGISARPSREAAAAARAKGLSVGCVTLKTIWPFNYDYFRSLSLKVSHIVVVEMNCGMVYHSIVESVEGRSKVSLVSTLGGKVANPESILEVVE